MTDLLSAYQLPNNFPLYIEGLVAAVIAALAILLFLMAMLTKHPTRCLQQRPDPGAALWPLPVSAALAQEFQDLGAWPDPERNASKIIKLMLEPGGQILLLVATKKDGGHCRLVTRLEDGRWIVTGSTGEPDMLGLELQHTMLRAGLLELLSAHRSQVSQSELDVLPFSADGIGQEMAEHERARAVALVAAGLARWRSGPEETWSYTFLGACKFTWRTLAMLGRAFQQGRDLGRAAMPKIVVNAVIGGPAAIASPITKHRMAPSASSARFFGIASLAVMGISFLPMFLPGLHVLRAKSMALLFLSGFALALLLAVLALAQGLRARGNLRRDPALGGRGAATLGVVVGAFMLVIGASFLWTSGPLVIYMLSHLTQGK